jgi:hypothetical protein
MSAVDFEVKLNWSFWQWIQGDNDRKVASGTLARHSIAKCYGNPGSSWLELSATPATFCVTSIVTSSCGDNPASKLASAITSQSRTTILYSLIAYPFH